MADEKAKAPNCYECQHCIPTREPYNCHMACTNKDAHATGSDHGIKNGWFYWPGCFDPVWLTSCDGFAAKAEVEAV